MNTARHMVSSGLHQSITFILNINTFGLDEMTTDSRDAS